MADRTAIPEPTQPTQLTPLALAALALLAEREMHPYEMFQLMQLRREERVVKVNAGSLYRAVERLDRDGLIESTAIERDGNRPERTVYRVTDAGRDAMLENLAALLSAWRNEYPSFPLAIGGAHHLPLPEVIDLLEQRRASIAEWLDVLDTSRRVVAEKGVPRRFVLDIHYLRAMIAAEDDWLAGLLVELRAGDIDWPAPPRKET
ncbi:PadR family transcriptional regulator [Agromyces sp. LHK192]|uniref:PadR family transcriptional regulator n=1 Tax=Agromyces sp. LHK192 TaxID=2498704 RepID=UPI000FDB639B|nr:helix-turn-helix transcriptional regulator [Agromyces sp. LHK192]